MEAKTPLTAEEEALKRNTDCIYFLASPFTCKKGNECEFRHSEAARVNPRDCWYWLNGNCVNPKCAFRHPPLDGLFGIPRTPSGPLPPPFQAVANAPGSYNPNKQSIPCYYFQKGQCLKGDKCLFMHGPHPASNHVTDQSTNGSHLSGNNDPQKLTNGPHLAGTSQSVSWGLKECNTSQQTIPKGVVDEPVEVLYSSAKSANKTEGPVKGLQLKKNPSPYPSDYEPHRFQPTVAPVSSVSTPSMPHHHQPQPAEEHYSNGREDDDFLGESSPGFDVLVDDEEDFARDSEYYHNEDEYGRNPNQSVNDFDYHHPNYEAVPSFERDQYNGKGEYDRYGQAHSQHDRDHSRASSERAMDRISKRRPMHRESSPDEMDGQDLRHQLSKQRRLSGLRSTVCHNRHGEPRRRDDCYVEDRYPGRSSGRPQESSFSFRLQGRIKLPARSPPHRPFGLHSERDRERGRSRGRLSPARTINYKGRPQDRIKLTPNEEFTADGRNFGVRPNRRDNGDPLNFAGPKSLAELKGAKVSGISQEQVTKSITAYEDSLSFEGPKPLGDILKRKRQSASGDDLVPSSGDENNLINAKGLVDSASAVAPASGVKEGAYSVSGAENPKTRTVEDDGLPYVGQSLVVDDTHEAEDGMTVGAIEDQEPENFDPRDGDSDYEAIEDEDFKTEYGENVYQEDEDDEDDFAKKVGVFFS